MFANLTQGSILYGVDLKNNGAFFTAPILKVSVPTHIGISQYPNSIVDITASINGEQREFKQVPSNSSIADFGSDVLILGDSRDALNAYLQSKRQERIKRIQGIEEDKKMVKIYDNALKQINPSYTNQEEVKALNDRIGSLEAQIAKMVEVMQASNKKA